MDWFIFSIMLILALSFIIIIAIREIVYLKNKLFTQLETITQLLTFRDCLNNMFDNLIAISEKYKTDGTAPGLVLSYIPDQKLYYASIVRYLYPKGEGKRVVCNVTGDKQYLIAGIFESYDKNKDSDVEKRFEQYLNWKNNI